MKLLFVFFSFAFCLLPLQAQEITSFDGFWSIEYYQDDDRITKDKLEELFEDNQEVMGFWKKTKTSNIIGVSSVVLELGFAGWAGARAGQDKNIGPQVAGTLGFAVLGIIYIYRASKNRKRAILTYNKQFDKNFTLNLVPLNNRNGTGLALRF